MKTIDNYTEEAQSTGLGIGSFVLFALQFGAVVYSAVSVAEKVAPNNQSHYGIIVLAFMLAYVVFVVLRIVKLDADSYRDLAEEYEAEANELRPFSEISQSQLEEIRTLSNNLQSLMQLAQSQKAEIQSLKAEKQTLEQLQGDLSNRINALEQSKNLAVATAKKDAEEAAFNQAAPYIEAGNKAKKELLEAKNRLQVLEGAVIGEFNIRSAINRKTDDPTPHILKQKQLLLANEWLFSIKENWGVKQSDLAKPN